ncbi:hypothetical protein Tco_0386248 [Tanacetum coccineum]
MGELTFFLRLQVKQKEDENFISLDKYVTEILKKFGFTDVMIASTPIETQKLLLKDEDDEEVDVHLYRSMIGSLMYLTSFKPDIMVLQCVLCARYSSQPKCSHLHAIKRIFRYLKGQLKLGLWYLKDSPFDLVAYTDSDYARAPLDRKSTTGELGKGSANPIDPHHTPTTIQPSTSQPQKKQKPRKPKRKDNEVPQPSGPTDNVIDEAVYKKIDDSLERAATTATSLDVDHDRVIDLEKTKTSQAQEIISLKRRVKRLEKKGRSRTHRIKRLYKVGLTRRVESSEDEGINLVSTHFDADTNMFRVHDLVGDEVVVETEVASKDVNLSVGEVTLAQALTTLKSAKPKADKVMLQEPEHGTITTTTAATIVTAASIRPKAKGLVIHEEEQATTPKVSSQQPS